MMRRPLPWMGTGAPATVRVLLVSADTLFAEAMSVCLHANDGIEVVGIAFDPSTAAQAVEVLRPTVLVLDQRTAGPFPAQVVQRCRAVHETVRTVLLANVGTPGPEDHVTFDALVPPRSSLDRVVAAVREVAWHPHVADAVVDTSDPGLSAREIEVLRLLAQGLGTEAVAARLHLSAHTVRNHVRNLMSKLEAHSRMEAVVEAGRRGVL